MPNPAHRAEEKASYPRIQPQGFTGAGYPGSYIPAIQERPVQHNTTKKHYGQMTHSATLVRVLTGPQENRAKTRFGACNTSSHVTSKRSPARRVNPIECQVALAACLVANVFLGQISALPHNTQGTFPQSSKQHSRNGLATGEGGRATEISKRSRREAPA